MMCGEIAQGDITIITGSSRGRHWSGGFLLTQSRKLWLVIILVLVNAPIVWLSEACGVKTPLKIKKKKSLDVRGEQRLCYLSISCSERRREWWDLGLKCDNFKCQIIRESMASLTRLRPLSAGSTDTDDGPHWSEDSSCVGEKEPAPFSRTLRCHPPLHTHTHRARRDKGSPDVKTCRPKVWAEEKRRRRKEGKMEEV